MKESLANNQASIKERPFALNFPSPLVGEHQGSSLARMRAARRRACHCQRSQKAAAGRRGESVYPHEASLHLLTSTPPLPSAFYPLFVLVRFFLRNDYPYEQLSSRQIWKACDPPQNWLDRFEPHAAGSKFVPRNFLFMYIQGTAEAVTTRLSPLVFYRKGLLTGLFPLSLYGRGARCTLSAVL
jgi:hypothetical protein